MRHVPGVRRIVRSGQRLLGKLTPSEGSYALLELSLLITEREVHRCLLTYVGSSVSARMRKPAVRPGYLLAWFTICPGGTCQRPCHTGGRLSRNARAPSPASSELLTGAVIARCSSQRPAASQWMD